MATRTVTGATKQRLRVEAKAGEEIAVFPPAFHICKRRGTLITSYWFRILFRPVRITLPVWRNETDTLLSKRI